MDGGWIKVWRKVLKNPVFKNNDPHLFKAFIYCLCRANHKENEVLMDGQIVKLNPGEFITGRLEASKDLHFKSVMWDRKLVILEKLGILNRQANNRFSKISIINWHIYQGSFNDDEQVSEQVMNNSRTTDEQLMNTDKNDKNVKNVKNDKKNIYGEFKNVKLLEKEYQKLVLQFGESGTNERIENLSLYIASKGKKYSSHYATILTWERNNPLDIKRQDDPYSHLEIARAKNGND